MARLIAISWLLLLTRAATMGLAIGALHFYHKDTYTPHSFAPELSSVVLTFQLISCFLEFTGHLTSSVIIGLNPFPPGSLFRLWFIALDTIFSLLTLGSASAVLSTTVYLRNNGNLSDAIYSRLMWHGGLTYACGIVSSLTAFLNLVALAKEQHLGQQQVPPAPA